MNPEPTDDVLTADTRPITTVAGRHVAPATTKLSIHAFVGGRFPRHRAEDRESPTHG